MHVLTSRLARALTREESHVRGGQLYSPVTQSDDGKVEVHLGETTPASTTPPTARAATRSPPPRWHGRPASRSPQIAYTEAENDDLAHRLPRAARQARAVRRAASTSRPRRRSACPRTACRSSTRSPRACEPLTGFRYHPAPGLVALREFYGSLGDRVFHSTQYVRHPSEPLYTPEPDIIHEVIGHGNMLASPALRRAQARGRPGRPARARPTRRCSSLADVFWFTMEFGVMREDGELRAYGAGILSSYGEIEEFRAMEIRPLDFAEMGDRSSTTSPSTSRSSTRPSRWTSSRTPSAASSRRPTTTRRRG